MTKPQLHIARLVLCVAALSMALASSAHAEVGVGSKPIDGAKVIFDGTRKMLDQKWTYWKGPRFSSSLPIKWKIVDDPVDKGTVVMTDDPAAKLAVFCTGPEIRSPAANLVTEVIGTALLMFGVLAIGANALEIQSASEIDLSAVFSTGIAPLLVGFLVWAIGLSLGGPTGYAINPARDLGPRIAHALLPIAGKGDSDWGYAWIPVVGPLVGGVIGALLFQAVDSVFLG